MIGNRTVPETTAHFLLSNRRRRETLQYLARATGPTTVRELSEHIAAAETGASPPPRPARETVYVSLIQTHLPALAEVGVIDYDEAHKQVWPGDGARDVRIYTEVVTRVGITWDEYYRYLGVVALLVVLAVQLEAPLLARVGVLGWVTLFLSVFAVSIAYQFRHVAAPIRAWLVAHAPIRRW
ncbi:MAG: hypothetical protein ABEJ57_04960 [Halobacteriaceae archaeon]